MSKTGMRRALRGLGPMLILLAAALTATAAEPPTVTLDLEEIWRLDGDGELLLGLPTQAAADAAGNLYVLDAQLNQVHVIAPDGALLRTLMREGEGPGEIMNPSDMVVRPDGAVGVLQEYPGKVVWVDAAGEPMPSIIPGADDPTGGNRILMMIGRCVGDDVVACGMRMERGEDGGRLSRIMLARYDAAGALVAGYVENLLDGGAHVRGAPREREMIQPMMMAWDVGPDGRVYVLADREAYRIDVYAPDGALERSIARDVPPLRRSDAERERLQGLFAAGGGGGSLEVEETAPAVAIMQRGVQVHPDGSLWVLPARGLRDQPDGVFATYDVFEGGELVRRVAVRCPGDPWNDRLLFLADGRVVRLRCNVEAFSTSLGPGGLPPSDEPDGEDTPAILCYRPRG